jgi:predicted ribonuclease YlaK
MFRYIRTPLCARDAHQRSRVPVIAGQPLDTNVYLEHRDGLEQLNFDSILAALEAPIRVLVPMMVIDELDSAKRLSDHRRGRATIALAVINRVVRQGGALHERDLTAVAAGGLVPVPGEVTLEVLSEPLDHQRLPNNDAEIVDRALAVQAAVGTTVTLVTFDTGMALRALEAGLNDHLLPESDRAIDQRRDKKANSAAA